MGLSGYLAKSSARPASFVGGSALGAAGINESCVESISSPEGPHAKTETSWTILRGVFGIDMWAGGLSRIPISIDLNGIDNRNTIFIPNEDEFKQHRWEGLLVLDRVVPHVRRKPVHVGINLIHYEGFNQGYRSIRGEEFFTLSKRRLASQGIKFSLVRPAIATTALLFKTTTFSLRFTLSPRWPCGSTHPCLLSDAITMLLPLTTTTIEVHYIEQKAARQRKEL